MKSVNLFRTSLLGALLLLPGTAQALVEGSVNTGDDQGLAYYTQVLIDVKTVGETIRICSSDDGLMEDGSLAPNFDRQGEEILLIRPRAPRCANDGQCLPGEVCRGYASGRPAAGGESAYCAIPFSVGGGRGFCDADSGPGNWVTHQATETGAYRLDLAGEFEDPTANTRYWAVSVQQPGGAEVPLGRVHTRWWSFNAHMFDSNPTDAQFYTLVPSGGEGSFVFVIDFQGMAGYVYSIFSNASGNTDTPSRSWCQYGSPAEDGTCGDFIDAGQTPAHQIQPQYEIYLNYPDGVESPIVVLTTADLQFNDEVGSASLSPDGDGRQDSGEFTFTSSIPGIYRIIIDTNLDGVFDSSQDVLLTGAARVGANRHAWSGTGPDGQPLAVGRYPVQLSLHAGETHFPMIDIESNYEGLAIRRAFGPGVEQEQAVRMFWDDTAVGGTSSLPLGTFDRHSWGWLGEPGTNGDLMAMDTWVEGQAVTNRELTCRRCEEVQDYVTINNPGDDETPDSDEDGVDDYTELQDGTNPNSRDTDGDGLNDGAEKRLGTDPLDPDTDGDGLRDGLEDADDSGSIDDGETDPRVADSDGDRVPDGPEVQGGNPTDPLNPDTDGDQLPDGMEDADLDGALDPGETDPNREDTDRDGLLDGAEDKNRNGVVDPGETDPRKADTDEDGLVDGQEPAHGTDPQDPDTDGDQFPDGAEVQAGTDPLKADTDDDGLNDGEEASRGTNPLEADTDDDGLRDGAEVAGGTDPLKADTDDDGLPDGRELELTTDPTVADTDGDGLKDGEEVTLGTDPKQADTDGDGLPDGQEVQLGTNPLKADSDDDGLADGREVELTTDPLLADTDGDGLKDGDEVTRATDPKKADTDGDTLTDGQEVELGTDPLKEDTDEDGLNDGREVTELTTDPTKADTDDDGLTDAREVELGTDPLIADPDNDGLKDGDEVERGTDPKVADTDGDGLLDGREVELGTDPLKPDTDEDGLPDGIEVNGANPTLPLVADTDGDGLKDGQEDLNQNGALDDGEPDPNDCDSDDDGVNDGDDNGVYDATRGLLDTDRDGLPDVLDPDSDNDRILDGTEVGVTAATTAPCTNGSSPNFVPDADPSTTTDPKRSDTDRGGDVDGAEDLNRNGRIDEGETDPNNPNDDWSRQAGGAAVAAEGCDCRTPSAAGGATPASLLLIGVLLAGLGLVRRR